MKRRSIVIAAIALLTLGFTCAANAGSIDVTTTGVAITGPVTVDQDIKDTSGHYVTVPPGAIFMFPLATPPAGYLECNGAAKSRTTYAKLFAVLGTTYGAGDGSTTFNLPDMRGQFVRGWDHGAGVDPDRTTRTNRGDGTTGDNVGTKQADNYKSHTHKSGMGGLGTVQGTGGSSIMGSTSVITYWKSFINSTGGNETRPDNIYMMYCIKY